MMSLSRNGAMVVRLTRVQQQARTRTAVLAAARQEFIEHGYGPARIDRIAERAELTRGAVYSNFPSKRALYLAVLVDLVETAAPHWAREAPGSVGAALAGFARAWLERLPLVDDPAAGGRLQLRSLVGVIDDDHGRAVLAELARLEGLLIALGLEACEPRGRRVRLAELAVTVLGGSSLLAELAPGFGDPFDRSHAVEHLASLNLDEAWTPPHLPCIAPADACDERWSPPAGLVDQITGTPVDLDADGVVVVLGVTRLSAAEEAVRAVRPDEKVTVAVVTSDPAEIGNLVRLRISDLIACLRAVFPAEPWDGLRLVIDDTAQIASALGVAAVDNECEAAVRIHDGVIIARAAGRGAAYAAGLGARSQGMTE
jgi:AcrR family transcriptional regulator